MSFSAIQERHEANEYPKEEAPVVTLAQKRLTLMKVGATLEKGGRYEDMVEHMLGLLALEVTGDMMSSEVR